MRKNRHSATGVKAGKSAPDSGESATKPSPDSKAAEEILKSANEAAGTVRNLFVSYILLAVYLLISVGSTHDEQLLRDSGVAVPFLSNISLPVSKFYLFAPWLFAFFHFELLLHFKLLADKLHAFNRELEPLPAAACEDLRQRLSSFPFSHWLAGERDDAPMQWVTGMVVWATLFTLPLFTLLALQVGFLPYHSDWITLSHRLAVLGNAAALVFFWPKLVEANHGNPLAWWLARLQAWPLALTGGLWWLLVACFAWECWDWFFDGAYLHQSVDWIQPLQNEARHGLIAAPLVLWGLYRAWRWAKRRRWTLVLAAAPLAMLLLVIAGGLIVAVIRWPEILLQRLSAFYAELFFILHWPVFVAGVAGQGWFGAVGRFPPFSWLAQLFQWMRRISGRDTPTAAAALIPSAPTVSPPAAPAVLLFAAYVSVLVAALPDTDLKRGHPLSRFLFEEGVSWLHRNLHLPEKLLVARFC